MKIECVEVACSGLLGVACEFDEYETLHCNRKCIFLKNLMKTGSEKSIARVYIQRGEVNT